MKLFAVNKLKNVLCLIVVISWDVSLFKLVLFIYNLKYNLVFVNAWKIKNFTLKKVENSDDLHEDQCFAYIPALYLSTHIFHNGYGVMTKVTQIKG